MLSVKGLGVGAIWVMLFFQGLWLTPDLFRLRRVLVEELALRHAYGVDSFASTP